jgi:hypothetical protein
MYESKHDAPLPLRQFIWRVVVHFFASVVLVLGSLLAGTVGYRRLEGLSWIDGFLNAAMLLGGMGPVESPATFNGKLFAGLYALYSGLLFLIVLGIVLAPIVHRALHRFHWES